MMHGKRSVALDAAARLGLFAAVAAALLLGVEQLTAERVAAQNAQRFAAELHQLLPGAIAPAPQTIRHLPASRFAANLPVQLFAVHQAGQLQAWVFDLTTPHGYSGDIRLLVALDPDGAVINTRILSHHETPGLGDRIEPQHSTWLAQFPRLGVALEPLTWQWRRAGGQIDSLSGATISARAVRVAIHHCIEFYVTELQALPPRP